MGYDKIIDENMDINNQVNQQINNQLDSMELSGLENIMAEALEGTAWENQQLTPSQLIDNLIHGNQLFDSNILIENITDLFLFEIKNSIYLGVQLVVICIVMGLLTGFSNSFGKDTVSKLGIIVCGFFAAALCMKNISYTYNLCSDSLNLMTQTMQLLLPVLIPLLIAVGGITTGSVLNPIIVAAITAFNTLLQKIILPMVFISSIFILINSMTERDYVNKLALFLRGTATFATGLAVTFFAGITAIQGVMTQTADGMLVNTARYSINNFVPIVGGFAADSVDMVMGCTGIIKNGISIFGAIIILVLLAIPIIKILAIAVVYKLTAILTEPLGSKQISDCLNEMGNSVITMAVILFLSALMFLIFLTIIIGIGGGSLWKL